MSFAADDSAVYPDFSGEREVTGELSELELALLHSVEIEVPKAKKPKGSRSRPRRHKHPKQKAKKTRGG